jgi:hypothetical protein
MTMMNKIGRYFLNLLIVLDELGNALTGGSPEETISSRSAKAMLAGKRWGCLMCKFLNLFQKDHCLKALEPATAGDDAVIPDDTP